jgi:hypothetical protein
LLFCTRIYNSRSGSSVWLECLPVTQEVEGSSPFRIAIEIMIAEITLQTLLAAIVGAIWATPLVVSPAARNSLDKEALKFFLKSYFFRFNIFLILMLALYLGVVYFFMLPEYELIWSDAKNLTILIILGLNVLNMFLGLIIDNTKIDSTSNFFKFIHAFSVAILASTSFVALYFLIEKFLTL